MLRPLFAPPLFFCLLLAPSLSQGEKPLKKEASPSADRHVRPTRLPRLKTCLLALLLAFCLGPGLSRAEGLFIVEPGLPEPGRPLQIAPLTDAKTGIPPAVIRAAAIYREKRTADAAAFCEQALIGDLDVLFALSALSRLDEAEQRPPRFGAPAAFWEDWAVRLLGGREAWFRMGTACYDLSRQPGLPRATLENLSADALRKAAGLGHPEAMFALAFLCETCPDANFRLPERPGFPLIPRDTDEDGSRTPEARYWMGAAAANGSARAHFYLGLAAGLEKFRINDARLAAQAYEKALRLGLADAALMLLETRRPAAQAAPGQAGGKAVITYLSLYNKMLGKPASDVRGMAERLLAGDGGADPLAGLSREACEEAAREADTTFAAIKDDLRKRQEARHALYEAAGTKIAGLRIAFASRSPGGSIAEQARAAAAGERKWRYPVRYERPPGQCVRGDYPARMYYPGDSLDVPRPRAEVMDLLHRHGRDMAKVLRELAATGAINHCQVCAVYLAHAGEAAAILRERALNGDSDVLVVLAVLSRLGEREKQPPLFGAPAAFWEDWAVRLLGEREAWYRIAVAGSKLVWCDDGLTLRGLLPLEEAALRKAAALGHPEAMYSLALFANYKVDPAFRLPEKPEFAIPPASPEAAPEYVYWLGAAAANGSAEACHAIGYLYSRRHSPAYDKRKAGDYFLRAARLGSPAAMAMLARNAHPLDRDGWFSRSECQASYTYHLLWQKMDSTASTDLPLDAMLHGGTERFPQACLTRAAYEEAWRQAEEEFAAIRIAEDEKEAARDALYEKARPLFAELRAAFAAQATEQTPPAGAGR